MMDYLLPYAYQRLFALTSKFLRIYLGGFAYMVIIGKGHSVLDIWPKTSNQGTGTEDIILRS